jgi:hypothetical protein
VRAYAGVRWSNWANFKLDALVAPVPIVSVKCDLRLYFIMPACGT